MKHINVAIALRELIVDFSIITPWVARARIFLHTISEINQFYAFDLLGELMMTIFKNIVKQCPRSHVSLISIIICMVHLTIVYETNNKCSLLQRLFVQRI